MSTTASQLIEVLQQYPADATVEVLGNNGDFGFMSVDTPESSDIVFDGDTIIPDGKR